MAKESRPILILAEKPSVARDIAKVVGASSAREGFLEGNGYIVTWALGHLVSLAQPHEMNPEWKSWRRDTLPMIPNEWLLTVLERTQSQFKIVKKLMSSCSEMICATDAGREGELIFRYIYQAAKCRKPVKRLWISSLTPDAIRAGLKNLQTSTRYDCLADAARGRSCADWLIGMNLSRVYAITSKEPFFVGRVQTPTLAMVVQREHEIQNFKPEDYFEIWGKFLASDNLKVSLAIQRSSQKSSEEEGIYDGFYLGEEAELDLKNLYQPKRLPPDLKQAQTIIDRIQSGQAQVKSIETRTAKQPPPFLYDLTELQRHTNRLFGFSASKTLEIAQALYERHKLISYPRTDSKHLSHAIAQTLPQVVACIRGPYEKNLCEKTGKVSLGPRYVNDSEVSDHHAIIPTEVSAARVRLIEDERRVYDLICRRLLSAWQEDYTTSVTTVMTQVKSRNVGSSLRSGVNPPSANFGRQSEREFAYDIFRSQGVIIEELGWKRLELTSFSGPEDKILPSALKKGLVVGIHDIRFEKRKTKAPPHLTEATLLTAMETAGRTLDDKELASIIRDCGLGTPATRAGIIETLLARKYMQRDGKSLVATELGIRLIATVHPFVKTPALTARWEKALHEIQNGKRNLKDFMEDLERELRTKVKEALSSTPILTSTPSSSSTSPTYRPFNPSQKQDENLRPEKVQVISNQIIRFLSKHGAHAAGRIYERIFSSDDRLIRKDFEHVLSVLAQQGRVRISQETFEKGGKTISYRKVHLDQKE